MIGKILSIFSGGGSGSVLVVDGDRLLDGGDRAGPVERVQLLQKLSRFAEREGLSVRTVLGGRPLREVDHGGEYQGVQVFFADSPKSTEEQLTSLVRRAGRSAVLVSASPGLEAQLMAGGASALRISTFKRGLDLAAGDGGGRGGSSQGGGGPRGGQRNRRRRSRRSGGRRNGGEGAPAQDASAAPSGGNDSSVKNLIDLVE